MVTSVCDLGVVFHLGLFLSQAVTINGWHTRNKLTQAPASFVPFRRSERSTTIELRRVCCAPPGVACANQRRFIREKETYPPNARQPKLSQISWAGQRHFTLLSMAQIPLKPRAAFAVRQDNDKLNPRIVFLIAIKF